MTFMLFSESSEGTTTCSGGGPGVWDGSAVTGVGTTLSGGGGYWREWESTGAGQSCAGVPQHHIQVRVLNGFICMEMITVHTHSREIIEVNVNIASYTDHPLCMWSICVAQTASIMTCDCKTSLTLRHNFSFLPSSPCPFSLAAVQQLQLQKEI